MCIRYAQRPGGVVTIIIANQGRNVNEQSVNFRFFVKIFKKGFLRLNFLSHGKYTGAVEVWEQLWQRWDDQNPKMQKKKTLSMDIYAEATEEKKQESFERLAATLDIFW